MFSKATTKKTTARKKATGKPAIAKPKPAGKELGRNAPSPFGTAPIEDLQRAASLMDKSLAEVAGWRDLARKIIVYWALGTHSLAYATLYPILVLLGKMGTGKTETLKVVTNFTRRPYTMSLRGMTLPAIRDKFTEAYEGTAIVEEADGAWKDGECRFENLLNDRYSRASAEASHKAPIGEHAWTTLDKKYFGATAIHRRKGFVDPALDGRSVFVRTVPDYSRSYPEFSAEAPWNKEGREITRDMSFKLPAVEPPSGVAPRIFNSYRPILAMARLLGDAAFEEQLLERLLAETSELREAQSIEPDGLVLRAVIYHVFHNGSGAEVKRPSFNHIKFSHVQETIYREHRESLQVRQIGRLARDLGFETKESHGVTVVVPTMSALLKACRDCEYADEDIDELRAGTK